MEHTLFYQLTLVFLIAGLIALLISLLKQPSVIAFILTGVLVGSVGYSQIHQLPVLSDLGEIGITLLLFMVGLELDMSRLKELGKVVLFTALGQILSAFIIGFGLARLMHFNFVSSFYIAVALAFTSTIIVVKLLGEKGQLQSLHARIAVGCSIVQDFAALIILLFVGGSSNSFDLFSGLPVWQTVLMTLVRALLFFLVLALISKKLLPWLLKYLARSDELLLSFSIGWALGLAAFASLPFVGFSFEIGGFLAGLALANSQVHWEIAARIRSIRDFFIIIFFIVFGSQIALGAGIFKLIPGALLLSLFMLIIGPLIVTFLLTMQGYKAKTAFLVGSAITPMSEFSFILVALGSRMGQIDQSVASLVTLTGLITIALSSYLITHAEIIYKYLQPILKSFEGKKFVESSISQEAFKNHVVLVGAHRLGQHLIATLQKLNTPLVLVDINPEVISYYMSRGLNVVCGDITESYIQEQVGLSSAKVIISTIPNLQDNLAMLEAIKRNSLGKRNKPKLIFAAQTEAEAKRLYDQEIDYALSPHYIGGQHLAKIFRGKELGEDLKKLREGHLKVLYY